MRVALHQRHRNDHPFALRPQCNAARNLPVARVFYGPTQHDHTFVLGQVGAGRWRRVAAFKLVHQHADGRQPAREQQHDQGRPAHYQATFAPAPQCQQTRQEQQNDPGDRLGEKGEKFRNQEHLLFST